MTITLFLLGVDLIWFLSVMSAWGSAVPHKEAWNSLRGIHLWSLFLSVIEILVKV
jgi:hypothetical protein